MGELYVPSKQSLFGQQRIWRCSPMKYDEEFVKRLIGPIKAGLCSIRAASKHFGVSRSTIGRWVKRIKEGLPTRLKRSAKRVWNKTSSEVLDKLNYSLASGKTVVE